MFMLGCQVWNNNIFLLCGLFYNFGCVRNKIQCKKSSADLLMVVAAKRFEIK